MLNVRQPTLFELDKAIESTNSQKRKQPVYSISKSERFPGRSRSAVDLAPGMYRMDVQMPVNRQTEVLASRVTRAKSSPKFSFTKDTRADEDNCLKGLSPYYMREINALGPGQYRMSKIGVGSNPFTKSTSPSYSI
eukprot:TRINITY_DN110446_c0_g1_i1.p1 TRINITY_DN110446_c0_g1~~TRINITY_DN110446_c0_g1_i1.p1  ORF type:complete len:154 (-),score=17.47 TRINITY_DN110446_c0_g1_i1:74-481(-)